jgi:glycosyltransferase involved in cell wall biosynthesis
VTLGAGGVRPSLDRGRPTEQLRVAFVAGTLGIGGAEKQLLYAARALRDTGVRVQVYTLTRGEPYEREFTEYGFVPRWVGRHASPAARMFALTRQLWSYRPHVVQSSHGYTNLYAALAGRATGALTFGALRSDLAHSRRANGRWLTWHLDSPAALVVNSVAGAREVREDRPGRASRVYVVPNVVEVERYAVAPRPRTTRAAVVARLIPQKRIECFLDALALARRERPEIQGVIVGDGPERGRLETHAAALGIADAVQFHGARRDVPAILARCSVLVSCSDHEGFANVLLEGMAAGLPVVTTPAGDSAIVVQDHDTGFVVPFGDSGAVADRLLRLASEPALGDRLGAAGRRRAELCYNLKGAAGRLLAVYRHAARVRRRYALERLLRTLGTAELAPADTAHVGAP